MEVLILVTVLCVAICAVMKFITAETSEDKYHQVVHKDVGKLDDAPIIKFSFKENAHYQKIKDNILNNNLFSKHHQQIKKFNPNFSLTDEEVLSDKSSIVRFIFKDDDSAFSIIYNHYYLGADSFLHLKSDILMQSYIPFPNSSYKACILLPKFVYDYHRFIKSRDFVPLPRLNQTRRYSEENIYHIEEYKHTTKRNYLLYKMIQELYLCLQLERPMRILIPVPFQRFNQINNNVGAIFILFNGDETMEQFCDMFNTKRYMAMVSNFVLISKMNTLFSDNYKVRKQIDVVLTSFYSNEADDLEYDLNWTTRVMPSEAMYVAVYSRIGTDSIKTNVTYTVATSSFKKTKTMEKYKME
jgi:hypothetical protein